MNKERAEFDRWVVTHQDNLTVIAYEENIMFDAWQAAKADTDDQITVSYERFQELIAIGVKAALDEREKE